MPEAIAERLGISTCWNSHRHTDGYEMIAELRELGFGRVELSHGISSYLVPGILQAKEEGLIKIDSVHNFCPLPSMVQHAAPNLFQPSTKRRDELSAWFRYTQRTLDFAKQVEATHVVMHSGSLEFRFRSPVDLLSSEEQTNRDRALKRLRKRSEKRLPLVRSNYLALLPEVEEGDLILGIENREGILELPLDADYTDFIKSLDTPHIQAWHDTGHGEIKRRLGLLDPFAQLESVADHMVGFHLHDVNEEGRDHQEIGTGTIDFHRLAEFFRPHQLLILELSPRLKPEQVSRSREALLGVLGETG